MLYYIYIEVFLSFPSLYEISIDERAIKKLTVRRNKWKSFIDRIQLIV